MVVVRHYPGDIAPWTGVYALVGHFGEPTDFAVVIREVGERLPVVSVAADYGPFWFVHVSEANEGSAAA
jgi:hypothetical protein